MKTEHPTSKLKQLGLIVALFALGFLFGHYVLINLFL